MQKVEYSAKCARPGARYHLKCGQRSGSERPNIGERDSRRPKTIRQESFLYSISTNYNFLARLFFRQESAVVFVSKDFRFGARPS